MSVGSVNLHMHVCHAHTLVNQGIWLAVGVLRKTLLDIPLWRVNTYSHPLYIFINNLRQTLTKNICSVALSFITNKLRHFLPKEWIQKRTNPRLAAPTQAAPLPFPHVASFIFPSVWTFRPIAWAAFPPLCILLPFGKADWQGAKPHLPFLLARGGLLLREAICPQSLSQGRPISVPISWCVWLLTSRSLERVPARII